MCKFFIDINNVLYWYNFVLYWYDAFILIKWLKQLRCIVYINCFIICILIIINKQKKTLSINEKCNKEKQI
jgi:hypothetical protein